MHTIRTIMRPPAHDPLIRTPAPAPEPAVQAQLRWCPVTVRHPGARPERMRVLARSRRQALEHALDAYPDAIITG